MLRPVAVAVRGAVAVVTALGAAALLTSCASPSPAERSERARQTAVEVVNDKLHEADAATQAITARLGARYGEPEFDRWAEVGARRLAEPTWREGPYAVAWRRVVDPDATVAPGTLEALPRESALELVAWVPATALHCDQPSFPADWVDTAERALATEQIAGYVTTHVGLGLIALSERGCEPEGVDRVRAETIRSLTDAANAGTRPDDLTLEILVVLAELDPTWRIDPVWVERIVDAQRPDGGFARDDPGSTTVPADWHTTLLAWWVLSAIEQPEARTPLTVP